MASDNGDGPKDYLQEILDKGSQGNPGGDKWQEFLKSRDGISGPNEPVSEKAEPEKEEPEKVASVQQPEPEKDEPEKD